MSSTTETTDEIPYLATFSGVSMENAKPSTGIWKVWVIKIKLDGTTVGGTFYNLIFNLLSQMPTLYSLSAWYIFSADHSSSRGQHLLRLRYLSQKSLLARQLCMTAINNKNDDGHDLLI